MVVEGRQRARSRKEQRCSECDGKGNEREAKERSDETKTLTETRQKGAYEEEPNKSISGYMSEKYMPRAGTRLVRPSRTRNRTAVSLYNVWSVTVKFVYEL